MAQLLFAVQGRGVEVRTEAPLKHLVTEDDGAVIGAVLGGRSGEVEVRARYGVMLAAGGFSRNEQMRAVYQPVTTTRWTSANHGDDGDGVKAGMEVGAAVTLMDESWWMPSVVPPGGAPTLTPYERAKPGSIIVDASGERYVNEAGSYMEVGQAMIRRNRDQGGAVPSWIILDARNRRRYPFGVWPAGFTPRTALRSGWIQRAASIAELAQRCGIDRAGLGRTVTRVNRFAESGRDEDFGRGEEPYDRYYGDSRNRPNPCLGPIDKAPFYGIPLYPGDIGTNGGLLTDEHARVLREDGDPIPGLYATGNCSASVMGRTYPGPGATIGPSLVFGYVGAQHAAQVEPEVPRTEEPGA